MILIFLNSVKLLIQSNSKQITKLILFYYYFNHINQNKIRN